MCAHAVSHDEHNTYLVILEDQTLLSNVSYVHAEVRYHI